MSLMNGLSEMGQSIATTAGTMSLEAQKADLETQKVQLANQLATQRESFGRQEAAGLASQAAVQQEGLSEKLASTTSNLSVQAKQQEAQNAADLEDKLNNNPAHLAGLKKATAAAAEGDPEKMARAQEDRQQAAVLEIQASSAKQVQDLHAQLQTEESKDNPDPQKISSLKDQLVGLTSTAESIQAQKTAAITLAAHDQQAVQMLNTQIAGETAKLGQMDASTDQKAYTAQKDVITDMQNQLSVAQKIAGASSQAAHALTGTALQPSAAAAPQSIDAPALPANLPQGSLYSPSRGMWRDPKGRFYDRTGKSLDAGASASPPATPPKPQAAAPARQPAPQKLTPAEIFGMNNAQEGPLVGGLINRP